MPPLTGEIKGLMVLGGSGQGKTAQLKRLLRTNTVLTKFKYVDDLPSGNTLYVTVPPEASLKKLAEIILDLTGYDEIHPQVAGCRCLGNRSSPFQCGRDQSSYY